MQEIKNNPQVYTTQEGIEQIKSNPQVYTTQKGIYILYIYIYIYSFHGIGLYIL